jgi:hypothetical protein
MQILLLSNLWMKPAKAALRLSTRPKLAPDICEMGSVQKSSRPLDTIERPYDIFFSFTDPCPHLIGMLTG